MWELATEIFKAGGFLALIVALLTFVEFLAIVYLFKLLRRKDDQLLEMSEKRLQDVTEGKEDYEELSNNLNKSIDLLIKVFRKQNGD